mmetsp:Transcript_726/g.1074  ORF Transcript_726/g.1074 Transcript_726/m.1074 type:complete len:135 (+) Transcript_726:391-795(+)
MKKLNLSNMAGMENPIPEKSQLTEKKVTIDWTSGSNDLKEAYAVVRGKATKVLRKVSWRQADPALCFSILWEDRTLDLQAPTQRTRDRWAKALEILLSRESEAYRRHELMEGGASKSNLDVTPVSESASFDNEN